MTSKCNFGASANSIVRDQLFSRITAENVWRQLFQLGPALTLQQVIQIVKEEERTELEMQEFANAQVEQPGLQDGRQKQVWPTASLTELGRKPTWPRASRLLSCIKFCKPSGWTTLIWIGCLLQMQTSSTLREGFEFFCLQETRSLPSCMPFIKCQHVSTELNWSARYCSNKHSYNPTHWWMLQPFFATEDYCSRWYSQHSFSRWHRCDCIIA